MRSIEYRTLATDCIFLQFPSSKLIPASKHNGGKVPAMNLFRQRTKEQEEIRHYCETHQLPQLLALLLNRLAQKKDPHPKLFSVGRCSSNRR
ncbi:hypothetical protein BESB_009810 [Besnoitia besnoiti]|uniref:Uncharacterized protein n=1 Tax=Besnoitia besnoiti TaxID=94643 RepID=A0A2A9MKZ7_BESBE|nr:hypothetical protein BESB_009810 [Besnoitia besnoiti]PFH38639.1 hypothetical protein BESB_009810 [Besnoitia besnoiti]